MQDLDFNGKKALVIGGTSSIGLSLAVQLKELGASVTVTGRNPPRKNSDVLGFIQLDFEKDGIGKCHVCNIQQYHTWSHNFRCQSERALGN